MNRKLLKKKKKMKVFKVLFLMIAAWSSAQNFTGTLQPVEKDGLTQIIVQPELLSALQNNWDYFRILDSKKNRRMDGFYIVRIKCYLRSSGKALGL